MVEWKTADLSGFLPDEMDPLISSAQSVATTTAAILSSIQDLLEAAKVFLVGLPIFDWLGTLAQEIEDFKNNFLATGIRGTLLWDYPLKQFFRSGLAGEDFRSSFVQDLANSFDDTADPERPQTTGNISMIVLVGGSESIPNLLPLFEDIKDAFSWWQELATSFFALRRNNVTEQVKAVEDLLQDESLFAGTSLSTTLQTQKLQELRRERRKLQQVPLTEDFSDFIPTADLSSIDAFINEVKERTVFSTYPDWQEVSLRTIVPGLVDVFDEVFDPLINALRAGRDIRDTIDSLINTIQVKIGQLEAIVASINEVLSQLDTLIATVGLSALFIQSTDGVEDLKDQLVNATNPPFTDRGFYFGAAFSAQGGDLPPFETLFQPISGS